MITRNSFRGHYETAGEFEIPATPRTTVRLLPDALVDQIAAGEVVERPASVVKELVENALDAGAGRIRIEVRDGGISWMAVTDDGCGMSPEDARMALQRHATSKLATQDDLTAIASYGFRGEALPAIASVSEFRLRTRTHDADEAFEVRIRGGERLDERAAGGPPGTRIEVANLFVNVPARQKFLKKPGTEWGHLIDWLSRLAMALPGVHFDIKRDDRATIAWPATSSSLDRIAAVLSEDEAAKLVTVEREDACGHLQAWVSAPDRTRSNANGLYLFVNQRPVRDKTMRSAVLQAYRDVLPRGRYPTAVVFLTVDPSRVDVNVHPAKWEVRFDDAQGIHRLIRRGVADAMAERSWLGAGAPGQGAAPAALADAPYAPAPAPAPDRVHDTPRGHGLFSRAPAHSPASGTLPAPHPTPLHPTSPHQPPLQDSGTSQPMSDDAEAGRMTFAGLRLLGQVMASYLVVEGPTGLLLVDQHAAHERVLYERLRAQWLRDGVARQGLLLPVTVEIGAAGAAVIDDAGESVARLGFDVEGFGDGSVVVRAIPALLSGCDPAELVRELAVELAGESAREEGADQVRLLRAADRAFATLACHSARRFGDHLEEGEQRAILEGLDAIPWAPTCPHGRPVAVALDQAEIERRFSRR